MKTKRLIRIAGCFLVVLAVLLLTTPVTHSEEATISGMVAIVEAITVEGYSQLYFGGLIPPSTSEAVWNLDPAAGTLTLTSGDATSTDPVANDHFLGSFRITGTPNAGVNFTIAGWTDFSDPYLSLATVSLYPGAPQALDVNGQLIVQIGGELSINPGVAFGAHTDAVITLTANY